MHITRQSLVVSIFTASILWPTPSKAQHLIWNYKPSTTQYTSLYGEVQVFASNQTIYFCGCNWWPGSAAGGYTGIQEADQGRHLMIFSIWDTSKDLHPTVVQQDQRTQSNRFGGEGTGAHTHLDYDWKIGRTYRFYAKKGPDSTGKNTLTRVFFYDEGLKEWVKEATISNPIGGFDSVTSFGGMLNSFLENWSGREREKPKLAVYRLWLGTSAADLASVNSSGGDGKWGLLNGSFYLAEGADDALKPVFQAAKGAHGAQIEGGKETLTTSDKPLSAHLKRELANLD